MPRLKLTALNVGKLRAHGGARSDYRDTLLPGLVLRVTPSGVRSWAVEYWPKGARKGGRATVGHYPLMDLAAARAAATQILAAVDRGERPGKQPGPAAAGFTVADMVERCLADLTLRPSTRREWERLAHHEIAGSPLGGRPAGELQRHQVRAWGKAIKLRSGWTANRAFEVLRRAYSWAIVEELLPASPCDRMPLPFEEYSSERVLSAEELLGLMRALDRIRPDVASRVAYADATRLLLLTGLRRAAVLGLRRGELEGLDGPDPRCVIPGGAAGRSKSGRAHVVPLVPAALEVVRRRLDVVEGECLFPVGRGVDEDRPMTWSWWWRDWLKARVQRTHDALRRRQDLARATVPRWTIHCLRHTLATHLSEDLQVAPEIVSLVLGHTIPGAAVTRVYDRSQRLGERRAALSAWAAWLEALKTGQTPGQVLPFRSR